MFKKFLLTLIILLFATNCWAELTKVANKQVYKTTLGKENDEVIIGDEREAEFKPSITFTKWNKENLLTLTPLFTDLDDLSPVSLVNNQVSVKSKNNKIGWYANPDPDNQDNFKFGLILYEKPSVNSWSFKIGGWEDFNFLYQGVWVNTEEFIQNGETWVKNLDEIDNPRRSLKVQGSYAIYHKTKCHYEVGKTNYQTGKFLHYYRPRFIDNNGDFIWADLSILNGVLTITVDQSFLNKAVFPVKVNDDVGYKSVGANESQLVHNSQCAAWKVAGTPASNGTFNYEFFAWWANGGDDTVKTAVYSDSSGKPLTRLGYDSTAVTITDNSTPGSFLQSAVDYGLSITSGTQYWLAFGNNANYDVYTMYDTDLTAGTVLYFDDVTSPPATWTDYTYFSRSQRKVSAYFSYTPSGAGGAMVQGHVLIF